MIKNIILDTNCLLTDGDCIYKFDDNNVIIPMQVIEELDKFKRDQTEIGKNARKVSRTLDILRESGKLTEGVKINNGTLKIHYSRNKFKYKESVDVQILNVAKEIQKKYPNIPCILVTRDINVRLRADVLGIKSENYRGNIIEPNKFPKGYEEIYLSQQDIDFFMTNGFLEENIDFSVFLPNQYLIIKNNINVKQSVLGKVSFDKTKIITLSSIPEKLGLKPKNKEQTFALDALLDPNIKLVSLVGIAGSGKTLCAIAAGYYQVMNLKKYNKMLVSRPIMPMGKDIGYLPGNISEKLDPWMQPIYDALNVLTGKNGKLHIEQNINQISVEPLTYIRGRSIHDQFMIIDEAQQLIPLEVKTILTRASNETKIILTGDIDQIDNPYVDKNSNGLITALQAFKNSTLSSHIFMSKGVRSNLAEEACNLL